MAREIIFQSTMLFHKKNKKGRKEQSFERPTFSKCEDIIRSSLRYEPRRALLSGGYGDFIAIESFISDRERKEIATVINGCCYAKGVSNLFRMLPNYNIKNEIFLWDNLPTPICRTITWQIKYKDISGISNYNFWRVQGEIRRKKREFNESSFIKYNLGIDISKFMLPKDYIVIHPHTDSEPDRHPRNYNKMDWVNTIKLLRLFKIPGVVLGTKQQADVQDDMLIDMNNKTTIVETIEILKNARGYIGIDSFLSILAAKLFDEIFLVKSVAVHVFGQRDIYFGTTKKIKHNFLKRAITVESLCKVKFM